MSGYLWKAFLEDDVATFRAVLESASYLARGGIHRGHTSGQVISFGLGTPGSLDNGNDNDGYVPPSGIVLTRADLNHRDNQGRTLLHLIASSKSSLAIEFARSLLEQSLVDIYMQDLESGWTALHRAFYHGNISVGIAILNRDMRDALDGISYSLKHAGGLIKIKDHEGNGPFDVLEQTLEHTGDVNPGLRNNSISSHSDSDDEQDQPSNPWTSLFNDSTRYGNFKSLEGHEAYTFGSNKNITLGFGDEDDRQFPERVSIRQPEYLMAETSEEFEATHSRLFKSNRIPSWLRYEPVLIHNVVMGRFSSAILSTDKSSNLHICGHGSGGRLGLGDERTRFQFTCVEGGGLAQKKIVAIALGHHHTLALSDNGEVFSWGTNTYGQLGYSLPVSKSKEPVQLLPRQIFGPIKREPICGIAASVNHSVVHTLYSLYAFGKNEGQLGIVDSDARSLEFQTTPRKVGGVKFSHAIVSTSAIERATVCLLSNKEVWVYANYGYSKISFPVVSMTNWFTAVEAERRGSSVRFHHHLTTSITKIAAAGETICGLSEGGAIYSFTVAKPSASTQSLSSSTTNPSKIRGALSTPQVIWSNKKTRLAARDVAVDQNGSIILVTEAGSVWKRVKRAKIKDATASGIGEYKPKDYKFSRISGLTSAIAVRASGIGAYAVVRQERKLPKDIRECQRTMESDLFKLCAFRNHAVKWKYSNSKLEYLLEGSLEPTSYIDPQSLDDGMAKYLANFDGGLDAAIKEAFADTKPYKSFLDPDVYLCSSTSDIQISVHRVLLGASGPIFREAVQNAFATTTALNDLSEVICSDSKVQLIFQGIDILTLFTFVYYLMTGIVLPLSKIASPDMMRHRFRRSRAELLKLAQHLQIEGLEDILKQRGARQNGYQTVLERFFVSRPFRPSLIPATDIMVCLADGEIPCHAAVLCQRCPFFSTLLHGRAQGRWLEGRHIEGGLIPIDLTHISSSAFECVLKWIYTDSMDSFADIGLKDLEDFIDKIIEILSIANELMMESLSLACQELLGNHVNVRNAGIILDAIAPCEVPDLKLACMQYMVENLESIIRHGQCDDLDNDLLQELDHVVRRIQADRSAFIRCWSRAFEEELHERHPDLKQRIAQEQQAKIDSIILLNKYSNSGPKGGSSFRAGSFNQFADDQPPKFRRRLSSQGSPSPVSTPVLKGQGQVSDFIFDMDEEHEFTPLLTPSKVVSNETLPTISLSKVSSNRSGKQRAVSTVHMSQDESLIHENGSQDAPIANSPRPWHTVSPLSTPKLSMRDIMDQTSSSRTSNLSVGLSENSGSNRRSSGTIAHAKMSQKERKKLQQQASQNTDQPGDSSHSPSTKVSPWRAIPSSKSKAIEESSPIQATGRSSTQLTMRQTIANPGITKDILNPETPKKVMPIQATESQPNRSINSTKTTMSNPSPIQIKSIRHTPMPMRPSASTQHVSMTDILSQQQAEKAFQQGGGEKRSLADIQAEQAFQEWWEKESARVQNEERVKETRENSKQNRPARRRGAGQKNKGQSSKQ